MLETFLVQYYGWFIFSLILLLGYGYGKKVRKWLYRQWTTGIHCFFDFIHNYILEIILISFIGLGICWGIGYFANALYGMKFELASCWAGFSAIGGAGVLAAVKYCTDSFKNTEPGVAPMQGLSAKQRLARMAEAALDIDNKGEIKNDKS
jgi:hypothetical protein